jgi:hypothetical protein
MSKSLGNFFTIRCGRTVAFWLLHSWGDRIFLALPHFSVAAMTQPSPDVPTCCACCCSCCSPCCACREVVGQYHPRALRWFLVNTQYRQPINYTQRALEEVGAASDSFSWPWMVALCPPWHAILRLFACQSRSSTR